MEAVKVNSIGILGIYFHKHITTTLKKWLKASSYLERKVMNVAVDYFLRRILKPTT